MCTLELDISQMCTLEMPLKIQYAYCTKAEINLKLHRVRLSSTEQSCLKFMVKTHTFKISI